MLAVCSIAAWKMCCIVCVGMFVLMKNQWLWSPTRQILKWYFHSLPKFKHNFDAQSENLKVEFQVLVYEYTQIWLLLFLGVGGLEGALRHVLFEAGTVSDFFFKSQNMLSHYWYVFTVTALIKSVLLHCWCVFTVTVLIESVLSHCWCVFITQLW